MNKDIKSKNNLVWFGMLILLAGVLLKVIDHNYGFVIYATGVLAVIITRIRLIIDYKGDNKRVFIPYLFSTVAFILAGYIMYINQNYWIVFILLASVLDLYFSFRNK